MIYYHNGSGIDMKNHAPSNEIQILCCGDSLISCFHHPL